MMKTRSAIITKAFLLTAALVSVSFAQMRDITTMQLVRDMGLGINLGNTFEARIVCDPGDSGCEDWIKDMRLLKRHGAARLSQTR
jgi:hypothetical protein